MGTLELFLSPHYIPLKKNYNILLYIVFFLPNISPNFFLLLRPAASRLVPAVEISFVSPEPEARKSGLVRKFGDLSNVAFSRIRLNEFRAGVWVFSFCFRIFFGSRFRSLQTDFPCSFILNSFNHFFNQRGKAFSVVSVCVCGVCLYLCVAKQNKNKTENVPNIFLYRTTFIGHLRDHIALQRHCHRTNISICDDLQFVTGILCCFSVCTSMIRFFGRLLLSTLSYSFELFVRWCCL